MADIDYLKPIKGEVAHPIFLEILAKADEGYGVVSGIRLHQTEPPSMSLASDSGIVKFAWMKLPDSGDTILFDASHSTLSRIDAVYWNNGLVIHKGDNQAIIDPKNNDNWKQYLSPVPKGGCPDGTILAMVFIEAGATAIYDEDIWMCAAPASDEPRHNNAAEAAPTIDDDQTVGYGEGSRWIDKTHLKAYRCLSAGDGAANWKQIWPPKVADFEGTIDHANLQNKGTNAHSAIDTFISSKAQASGLASLDGNSKVVQDPANATATPAQGKIPIAGAGGLIGSGWITGYHTHGNKTLLDAYNQANTDLADAVTKKHTQALDDNFNGLTENSAIVSGDYLLYYDVSVSAYRKVKLSDMLGPRSLQCTLDSGDSSLTLSSGIWIDVIVDYPCTIAVGSMKGTPITGQSSGSAVVDVWKKALASGDPDDANSITASAPLTMSSAVYSQNSTLTGWTKTLAQNDVLRFNVDSCTNLRRLAISLRVVI